MEQATSDISEDTEQYVQAQLIAETTSIQPGRSVWMGVQLAMDPGWHTYWRNPGDAGLATTIAWDLPPGFRAGEIQWPMPSYFLTDDLVNFGYQDEVWLLVELSVPRNVAVGERVQIHAAVEWLACAAICVPGTAHLMVTLPVTASTAQRDPTWQSAFQHARHQMPRDARTWDVGAHWQPGYSGLIVQLTPPASHAIRPEPVAFYPSALDTIQHVMPQPLAITDRRYALELLPSAASATRPSRLQGVVVFGAADNAGEQRAIQIDVPIAEGRAHAAVNTFLAPDFTLPGIDQRAHTLADYRGQYVVLEWLNPDCPFVRKHYDSHNMQTLQRRYTERGVVWFSISSSAPGKQGHLTRETALAFMAMRAARPTSILLDHDGAVGHLYQAMTTPHMFVIDPTGALIYAGAIDDTRSTDPADVERATNYVAQVLDAALAGQEVSVSRTQPYGCSVKYR